MQINRIYWIMKIHQVLRERGMGMLNRRRWTVITHLVNQFVMLTGGPDQWVPELDATFISQSFYVRSIDYMTHNLLEIILLSKTDVQNPNIHCIHTHMQLHIGFEEASDAFTRLGCKDPLLLIKATSDVMGARTQTVCD